MSGPNRRDVLKAAGAACLLTASTPRLAAVAEPARREFPFKRQNIWGLAEDSQTVRSLKQGIAEMKLRDKNPKDPLGWLFQANIHGANQTGPNWNMCQHGHWWFLPWHRAYLYFFERIIRKLSGDSTFALPYWNWANEDEPAQRGLPPVFYTPADESNKLWDESRNSYYADGSPLPRDIYQMTRNALGTRDFIQIPNQRAGFGGRKVTMPRHKSQPHGRLELNPHDDIHTWIGGDDPPGHMRYPETAARDPIFWLHHANIERLWRRWLLDPTHKNPTGDTTWMDQSFSFFDENGDPKSVKVRQFLETEPQNLVDYAYDDDPTEVHVMASKKKSPTQKPVDLVAKADPSQLALGRAPAVVTAQLKPPAEKVFAEVFRAEYAVTDTASVILSLSGLQYKKEPGGVYRVYLNLPPDTPEEARDLYHIGNLSFFGTRGHEGKRDKEHQEGSDIDFEFDATKVVRALNKIRRWKNDQMTVTFIGDPSVTPKDRTVVVPFKRLSLYVSR